MKRTKSTLEYAWIIKSLFVVTVILFNQMNTKAQDTICYNIDAVDSLRQKDYCTVEGNVDFIRGRPVCGCDSMTYFNLSCAYANGIVKMIDFEGGCDCIDSSYINKEGLAISSTNYDELRDDDKYRDIVCGCNGKTYLHSNIALFQDGVTKWTKGPCNCKEESYIDSSYKTQMCYENVQSERLGNRDRSRSYICGCDSVTYFAPCWAINYAGIMSWREGKCACVDSSKIDTTTICNKKYDPVCGCDGITYDNMCIAENHAGLINYTMGECKCVDSFYIDTFSRDPLKGLPKCDVGKIKPVCGCDGVTYVSNCYAEQKYGIINYKDGLCRCVEEENIDLAEECGQIYRPVCGCDGLTYLNACVALKHKGMNQYGVKNGPCSCTSSALQDSTYDCNELSVVDRVCGCDSVTYINECVAMKYGGVTTWKKGWCTYSCVDSNLIDTIKFCTTVFDPVCGCDSVTYTNECVAFYRNGMTSWTKGECFTKTSEVNENIKLTIYPNPTNGLISVDLNSKGQGASRVDVLDQNGSLLMSKNYSIQSRMKMNIQGFPNGIYFVRVNLAEDVIVKKVVKY